MNNTTHKPKILSRLPKINLVIGKKQLVIAGLTLVLGAAVYVNYIYAGKGELETATNTKNVGANYGDAELVSVNKTKTPKSKQNVVSPAAGTEEYFAQARIDKQASRDEAKEFIEMALNGGDMTSDERAVAANNAQAMTNYIESETKIETLLKAQGFDEALCYLSDKGANIIVKTQGLSAEDAAKIKTTLLSEVNIPAENITIVEIK
jgi:stage III sporulation protein AH